MRFSSGEKMTARSFTLQVREVARSWKYDRISIGFPGPVVHGKPAGDAPNLGGGWTRCNFARELGKPVKFVNDAAMQALGSYGGGRMLFLGLGTGVGSALILDDVLVPLELGELLFCDGQKLEAVLGQDGLQAGRTQWGKAVKRALVSLRLAFSVDYVVVGGGNAQLLKRLPPGARRGRNRLAALGGERLWRGSPITARIQKHTLTII